MADVGRDRGQLILVTGLLVAVAIIGLVMLLNTAIYTENLASRGADQSGREATEYRATVIDGVGGLIDAENDRQHASQAAVEGNVTDGIGTIDNYTARNYATGGTAVEIDESTVTAHDGRLIRQNASGPFESSGGGSDWTLATDVENARGFVVTVDRSGLNETNETVASSSGAFHVLVDGGSTWNAYVYRNESTPNDVTVATDAGGTVSEHCSVDASEVTIDLSGGTVDGEPCPGLRWAEGVSPPYDVKYRNGENATGTYNLTANTTSTGALNDGRSNPTSPYWVPAVYSAEFSIRYESPTLTYRTHVRVAPGEPE